MSPFSPVRERWMWTGIIVMILLLLVYLPVVILQNGGFRQLLTQVQQQALTEGLQVAFEVTDEQAGVMTASVVFKRPEKFSFDQALTLSACFLLDEEQLCRELEYIKEDFQQLVAVQYFHIVLPFSDSPRKYEIHYTLSVTQESSKLSELTGTHILRWEPQYLLSTVTGERVLSGDSVAAGMAYLVRSRRSDVQFFLDNELLAPQKMVSPDDLTVAQFLDEDPAYHTWIVVVPEYEGEGLFCVGAEGSRECHETAMTPQSMGFLQEDQVQDPSPEQERAVNTSVSLFSFDDKNVLFVQSVINDKKVVDVLFTLEQEGNTIPLTPRFFNEGPYFLSLLDLNKQYFLNVEVPSAKIQEQYLLKTGPEPALERLKGSAFSALEGSLGSMSLEWGSSERTRYDTEKHLFYDLDGQGLFSPVLLVRSRSQQEGELILRFDEKQYTLRDTILPNTPVEIPLQIKGLEYGDHEMVFQVFYADGSQTEPMSFEFSYHASQAVFETRNLYFLALFFGLICIVLLYSRLRTRFSQ